ncbi:hypothetical protein GGS23DRAFT_602067 [Durotheca rogersii]|uniref:uncharacterized protein n=1 Tax=Durotheca rogersii TaxID=419775 RepID=UPI0022202564|nr:uncharacterized protein GGS23DRAFT_602067 [Durotheca rogersii]KAI5868171.1 hypothetical protein GGS23DRAFT_602067 [Durotheca rogersii]
MSAAPLSRPDLTRFGYSSSSDSEDEVMRKPNSGGSSNSQKKKKKRKSPPQKTINKIWRRFTAKEFTKALAILPFDPVPLPSTPERPNELLWAGYERARDECSRKVKKIISECKRVNTRYRDPGFDLDWDLKWSKGYCLNYLGSNKFDLSNVTSSANTTVPKAVKRVHEIFEKPTFMKNISAGDIKQGSLGDCWLIASFSTLANVEGGIERMCVEYDTRVGIYGFVFYRDGEWVYSIIDDKLYLTSPCWDSPSLQREMLQQDDREETEKIYRKTYQTGSKALFFGQCKDQHETWVALAEKAYAKAHGDYGSLAGGWIGEGLEDLSGGVTTELLTSDILDIDAFWDDELSKVNREFLFGCATGLLDGGYGDRNGIREGHAYVVMDARTLKNGQRLVKLRNPWGKTRKGVWEGPWSDGSKEWNNDVKNELDHQFGNDSVFWIPYEDMLEKLPHFDRTRLFRDPDWRCCQRWIGVEVPWKSQWNEKFHIKLTKESPLVLVLQQLDNRYYRGLHGQYNFRLHFRMHEQGRPDSEDYIVRSHGNYLMDRSVSVEIPSMEPGNYSIFISIEGERNTHLQAVEDVVKEQCRKRVENEKLAQVGYAYDLAHSKGVAHLEQVAKLRKTSNQKKASSSRMEERRKQWERRHLRREITKKQKEKNQEKCNRRWEEKKAKAEAEAAAKKKQEEAEAAEKEMIKKAEEAERKKEEEEKPKNAAVQTDEHQAGEDKSSQTDPASTEGSPDSPEPSGKAKDTESGDAHKPPAADTKDDQASKDKDTPAAKGEDASKPEPACSEVKKPTEKIAAKERKKSAPSPEPSDGDSSDSPIEDWELLYSSDDMSKKPRAAPAPSPAPSPSGNDAAQDSDGESKLPEPWNAVCVAGFRVYSKDEGLVLRVVVEGGDMAENGMGEKGAADIDNAQMNAGGEREKGTKGEPQDGGEEVEIVDGVAVTKHKVVAPDKDGDGDQEKNEGEKGGGDTEAPERTAGGKKPRKKKAKKGEADGDEGDDEEEMPEEGEGEENKGKKGEHKGKKEEKYGEKKDDDEQKAKDEKAGEDEAEGEKVAEEKEEEREAKEEEAGEKKEDETAKEAGKDEDAAAREAGEESQPPPAEEEEEEEEEKRGDAAGESDASEESADDSAPIMTPDSDRSVECKPQLPRAA